MNKSAISKYIENVEKHIDIRLVHDEKKAIELAAKTNYVMNLRFLMNI